jgi:hypothetical protein
MAKYGIKMFYTIGYYHEAEVEAASEQEARDKAGDILMDADIKREWIELDDTDCDFEIYEIK